MLIEFIIDISHRELGKEIKSFQSKYVSSSGTNLERLIVAHGRLEAPSSILMNLLVVLSFKPAQ